MASWNSQQFQQGANAAGTPSAVIASALAHARNIRAKNPDQAIVFTLSHIARRTGLSYSYLLDIAGRQTDPYRSFQLRKRSLPNESSHARRYRTICIPEPDLMALQRWVHNKILRHHQPHRASSAYAINNKIFNSARIHTNSRWLIKIDIHRFFESITENHVANAFKSLGYPHLLCFQLARLCTRLPSKKSQRHKFKVRKHYPEGILTHNVMGFLPQGAPSSPLLANLVMRQFDEAVDSLATQAQLRYTRYADDLIFSTADGYSRADSKLFIQKIYDLLGRYGFEANRTKTVVSPPGNRKVVLGLLVDGDEPKLTKQFKDRLRIHMHFLTRDDIGPSAHAAARQFASVIGLQNHLFGLVAFAGQIEPAFAKQMKDKLSKIKWPA